MRGAAEIYLFIISIVQLSFSVYEIKIKIKNSFWILLRKERKERKTPGDHSHIA